jgi:arylsulfatase A-like enzyme/Flp pilus assembly protein TadD
MNRMLWRQGAVSAALAAVALCSVGSCRARSVFPKASVVLISIDTLRADHLPAYGYSGVETPALDSLARDSILFENAYSHVPLTLPSHTTLFTGLLPFENGVRDNTGYTLDPSRATLAETLQKAGYATGGAVSAVVLAKASGIARGFDFYEDTIEVAEPGVSLGSVQRSGFATEEIAEKWISGNAHRPFFFFLHLYEPHTPYQPPEPYASRYRDRPYDGEIATADAIVGKFLTFLKSHDVYHGAVVVLLSDHGEGLGDHGEDEHGLLLYRESIRVPLIVKLPTRRRSGERVAAAVGLIDVFPSLASLLGISPPAPLSGLSLFEREALPAARALYSETLFPRYHFGWSDLASLETASFQYIHSPTPEAYDLAADPGERRDIAHEKPPELRRLRAQMIGMARPRRPPGTSDPEAVRRLAALGYIGASSPPDEAENLPNPREHLDEIRGLKEALLQYQERRYPEALATLKRLLAKNPAMSDAWGALAETEHKLGANEAALEALRRQDQLTPGSPHILLSFANEYLELNNLVEARRYAERALALSDLPDGHELLARIAIAGNDLEGAERESRRALEQQPGRTLPLVVLAQVRRARGDLTGALTLLDEALEKIRSARLPEMSNLHYLRGDTLARLGRSGQARAEFQREIDLFPGNASAYAGLAFLDASEGRPDAARATLERLILVSPTPRSYQAASEAFRILGERQRAVELAARAQAGTAHPPVRSSGD